MNLCEILVYAHAQSPTAIYRDWKFKPTCARSLYARAIPNYYFSRLEIQANLCEVLACAHNPQQLFIQIVIPIQLVRDPSMRTRSPTFFYLNWKLEKTCSKSLYARTCPTRYSFRLEILANLCEIRACAQSPTMIFRDWKFKSTCARSLYGQSIKWFSGARVITDSEYTLIIIHIHA